MIQRASIVGMILLCVPATATAQAIAGPNIRPQSTAISTTAVRQRHHHAPGDPIEGINRGLFSVHQFLDRIAFRPMAMVYKTVVPKFLRTGVRQVISNLSEPVVFLNDVLQLKPKRAVRTLARFTINSTLGVGGIVDVAKGEKLPHRSNGFGNTLGRYGVKPGPYLFIPLVGPTDLRDLVGGQGDGAVLPLVVGNPFNRAAFIIPYIVLGGLDQRVEADADLKALLSGAADPYATLRSVYLQSRAAEIRTVQNGDKNSALDDPLKDPDTSASGGSDIKVPPSQPDVFDTTPSDPDAVPATH
jgi:phospholipid-binding lipoprotein MlaA